MEYTGDMKNPEDLEQLKYSSSLENMNISELQHLISPPFRGF